ncbi:MAG: HEAT repeat domain-containing protein [bacterium]|nr:HEAT repeat domain-containing protein [bacterium]
MLVLCRQHILVLLVIIMVVLPVGCDRDQAAWQKATGKNTVAGYEEYLRAHPGGKHIEEARERIFFLIARTSTQRRTEAEIALYYRELALYVPSELEDAVALLSARWNEVLGLAFAEDGLLEICRPPEVSQAATRVWHYMEQRCGSYRTGAYLGRPKAHVLVKQTYERADNVSLPFLEYAENVLNHAGFEAVREDAEDYAVTLHIEAEGIPSGAWYQRGSTLSWQWTTATLRGEMSFSVEDRVFSWEFSASMGPFTSTMGASTPDRAPFWSAFGSGFEPVVWRAIVETMGLSPLISALLTDNNPVVRKRVATVLGEMGNQGAAEALTAALEDRDGLVREAAAAALEQLGR